MWFHRYLMTRGHTHVHESINVSQKPWHSVKKVFCAHFRFWMHHGKDLFSPQQVTTVIGYIFNNVISIYLQLWFVYFIDWKSMLLQSQPVKPNKIVHLSKSDHILTQRISHWKCRLPKSPLKPLPKSYSMRTVLDSPETEVTSTIIVSHCCESLSTFQSLFVIAAIKQNLTVYSILN